LFELKGAGYFVTVLEQSSFIREESADKDGALVGGKPDPAVEYDVLGAFPISKINFVLQEPGFYRIRYMSRREGESAWRARDNMELSMIRNEDGRVRSNAPTSIAASEDRYWRVEFDGAFHGAPPTMRISWRPGEVYFLAQGKAPFILAFGSRQQRLSLQNDAFLQGRDASAMEVELGEAISIDSVPGAKRIPIPGEETPEWQRYLVWGLLVLGGLLLSGMALKLMRS
jgi:hypothetical protein